MRLVDRIKQIRPCAVCGPEGLWISGSNGQRRCACLRGRLLDRLDGIRAGTYSCKLPLRGGARTGAGGLGSMERW